MAISQATGQIHIYLSIYSNSLAQWYWLHQVHNHTLQSALKLLGPVCGSSSIPYQESDAESCKSTAEKNFLTKAGLLYFLHVQQE